MFKTKTPYDIIIVLMIVSKYINIHSSYPGPSWRVLMSPSLTLLSALCLWMVNSRMSNVAAFFSEEKERSAKSPGKLRQMYATPDLWFLLRFCIYIRYVGVPLLSDWTRPAKVSPHRLFILMIVEILKL